MKASPLVAVGVSPGAGLASPGSSAGSHSQTCAHAGRCPAGWEPKHRNLPPRRIQGTGARAWLHVARCSGATGRDLQLPKYGPRGTGPRAGSGCSFVGRWLELLRTRRFLMPSRGAGEHGRRPAAPRDLPPWDLPSRDPPHRHPPPRDVRDPGMSRPVPLRSAPSGGRRTELQRVPPRPAAPIARGLGAPGRSGLIPGTEPCRAVPCRAEPPSRSPGGARRPRERPWRGWRGSGPPPCCCARRWAPGRGGRSPSPSPSPSRTRRCPGTAASTTCWAG